MKECKVLWQMRGDDLTHFQGLRMYGLAVDFHACCVGCNATHPGFRSPNDMFGITEASKSLACGCGGRL